MDAQNDLNVYIDMAKNEGIEKGDEPATCCSKASSELDRLDDPAIPSWNLADTDLNEWAGESS